MVRTYDSWSEMYYGHSWEREWTFGYIVIKACDARFDGKLPVRRLFQQVWLMYRLRNVCSNYLKTKFPFRSRIFDSVSFENPFQKSYLTNNLNQHKLSNQNYFRLHLGLTSNQEINFTFQMLCILWTKFLAIAARVQTTFFGLPMI